MEGIGRYEQVDASSRRTQRAELPCCDTLWLRAVGFCSESDGLRAISVVFVC